jgi:excisionase family DNA binding protein
VTTPIRPPVVDLHPVVVIRPNAVSVAVAAQALGISEDSVYTEIRTGTLRHFRYGKRILIPVTALDEWVEAREAGAA